MESEIMNPSESLLENPGYRALWHKALEGFREISGRGWERRADYAHFWPLTRRLYAIAYGPRSELPEQLKAPLGFMLSGQAGRVRKGIRARPYFHHVLMVVFLSWLIDSPETTQLAAISHDDLEDIPKNLGVSAAWVENQLAMLIGMEALQVVRNLTNTAHPNGKHASQLSKIAVIPRGDASLKILDRVANLFDMRQDRPKRFGPDRISLECDQAFALARAMPLPPSEPVLALLVFAVDLLARENKFKPLGSACA